MIPRKILMPLFAVALGGLPTPHSVLADANHLAHVAVDLASPRTNPPPEMPADRCSFSRVVLLSGGAAVTSEADSESSVTDGDRETATALAPDGNDSVEIHFIGAPRWLNRVDAITDAGEFAIDVLDLNEIWRRFGTARANSEEPVLVTVKGDDVKARGLRFVPTGSRPYPLVRLTDISAWFHQTDPDDEEFGRSLVNYYESFWINQYPGPGNDLSKCDNDARGLRDALPAAWSTWEHGNYNAKERYVKRHDMGTGNNNDHADLADLTYFSGHGSGSRWDGRWSANLGAMRWGGSEDDRSTVPGDAYHAWGNNNLEWIAMSSCKTLKSGSRPFWSHAMDGLHLICGAATNINDANYGRKFGRYMVDSGAHDSAKKIKTSWFDAIEYHNGWYKVATVIGESSSMGNDYLWGQGTVAADPVHTSGYYYWTYNVGVFRNQPALDKEPAPDDPERASRLADPVFYPAKTERGHPVVIDRSWLRSAEGSAMLIYDVLPANITPTGVQALAQAICQTEMTLCSGQVGPGDPGDLNVIEGAAELRVCVETGAVHYEDTSEWLEWRTAPPLLPAETNAISIAEQTLSAWGIRPPDAVFAEADKLWQGHTDATDPFQPVDDPTETFPIAARVSYERWLDDGTSQLRRVVGPGGSMTVGIGESSRIQRVFQSGWRPLAPGIPVTLISITDVIDALNVEGSDAAINGIGIEVSQIQIDSWDLGYWEPACDEVVPTVRPVYILQTTITEDNGALGDYEAYVWADALQPRAFIDQPPDGSCFAIGEQVYLAGTGQGGVSPLTYWWEDDLSGVLGTGPTLWINMPAPPTGHSWTDGTRTIRLVVLDALGQEAYDDIELCYTGITDALGLPNPAVFSLSQSQPNPFDRSTRIAFTIPGSAGESVETTLRVYNAAGRLVRELVNGSLSAGPHEAVWHGTGENGHRVAAGVYFYRFEAGEHSRTKQVVLLK